MTGKPRLKIVGLPPVGGAAKNTSLVPGAGEDFDQKLAAYKQRMKTHTDAIKKHLAGFIEKNAHAADWTCVTAALLELGFERQIELHGEDDAKDLTDRCFRRVIRERRGPPQ